MKPELVKAEYVCVDTYVHLIDTHAHLRLLRADVPVSSPGPASGGFEALFGQFNSSSDVAKLGVGQTCSSPAAHQGESGLVLILEQERERHILR